MKKYVGAIDQGTSSTRFILFDRNGHVCHKHQKEITNYTPQPGWVEHDPMQILSSVQDCIQQVMSKEGVSHSEVAAIGITNQRETTIVWDSKTGKPLHNAVVWSDTRTRDIVHDLIEKKGSADVFREHCGLPISTYFSGIKLRWLLDNVPAIQQACKEKRAMFGTVESWLLWNLTGGVNGGVHATDCTNASRTMLMNINSLKWDDMMIRELGVAPFTLPEIRSNSEVYGALANGPLKGTPISGCVGDQQAALVGQLCLEPGTLKNTYGTGCFMLLNTGTKAIQSTHGLLTTVAAKLGKNKPCMYALEGSIAVAGLGVTWLRDNLKLIKDASEIGPLALSVPDNGHLYFVPAFSGLLSPYWRPDARGVFVGLTLHTSSAHFARAVLESAAYQVKDVAEAMQKDAGVSLKELKVDGGMAANEMLMQFQADQLGVPVQKPKMMEATALGAAIAAGLSEGVSFWSSEQDIRDCVGASFTTFSPHPAVVETHALFYRGWKRAVEKTFNLAGPPPPLAKL